MRAGDLDRRIRLQRASAGTDDYGGPVADPWVDLVPGGVAAQYTPISDGERVRAEQVGASVTDRFLIRWSSVAASLTPADQVLFEDRVYGITAVKPVGRRVGLEITASARVT
jgi:SPP1 family predicted phage head-tail adaptor